MPTIPTQNAVPSEAARDLKFNAGKIDEFVTSLEHEYKDRFGRCHMTIEGMRWIFENLMERFKVDINQAIIAAGYIPMDSFQQGAEITRRNEILRDETTGEYYRWDGDLPKSVPAGSTPESAGGVGVGAWVSIGDASLRAELSSDSGAEMIGYNGSSVKVAIDGIKLSNKLHKKRKVFDANWSFPDYQSLISEYGYSILIPQGLAIDDDYYYISYDSVTSGGGNKWHWIVMYKRNDSSYVGCFSIPNTTSSYPESLYVRDIDGAKIIYVTANDKVLGYDITSLPSNKGQVSAPVFSKDGVSSFAPSSVGLACFMSDFENKFIVQVDWNGETIGVCSMDSYCQSLTDKSPPYSTTRTKVQSRAMLNGELIFIGGGQYKTGTKDRLPAFAPSYLTVNGDGSLKSANIYNPLKFLKLVAGVENATTVENEGCAVDKNNIFYSLWYYESPSPYTINLFILEEFSDHIDSVDVSSAIENVLFGGDIDKNIIRSYDATRFNPYTGMSYSNCDSVCEMMRMGKVTGPLTMYVASAFYFDKNNTHLVPSGTKIVFSRINEGTVFMECSSGNLKTTVTSTASGQLTFNRGQIGGNNDNSWFGNGDFAILGMNGLGVVATKRAGTAQSIHHRFENANGVVGTIETTSNSTLYNTSSDIRQKNIIGDFDGLDILRRIVELGGVKDAEFKNDIGNHYPMLIAQAVKEHFPNAVSLGEDGFYDVDYSKLMPLVIMAIYQLSNK
ncbi:hypothetical protein RN616_12440 [Morganella morganii]|uniref:tail fiber/spike domain-containing protein n=1 Tax=Morganella morganii TaxID=582 RepID=UPI0028D551C8|nr:hypothetical protein [Morganella morganii]WNP29341.1 hypothetical protein RN616_12440 [Morganella morganii]